MSISSHECGDKIEPNRLLWLLKPPVEHLASLFEKTRVTPGPPSSSAYVVSWPNQPENAEVRTCPKSTPLLCNHHNTVATTSEATSVST